jgi:seryl-tRNA synthetase
VTNLFRDVILSENNYQFNYGLHHVSVVKRALMVRMYELNRLHQFDKVEIVRVEHPDKSYEALDGMVEHVKIYYRN